MTEQVKRIARVFLSIAALLSLLSITTPTGDLTQDVNFRLINIERRLDQVQQRVDFVERALQNQSFNRTNDSSAATAAAVLEMQRKQLSLSEQVLLLERRMLDMQKTIDRLRVGDQEAKETKEKETPPKSEAKPKPKQ